MKRKLKKSSQHPQRKKKEKLMAVAAPQNQEFDEYNQELVQLVDAKHIPAVERAQDVTFRVAERGLDYVPGLVKIITDRDESQGVTEMIKTMGQEPLVTERYLGPAKLKGMGNLACAITGVKYAWVTSKGSPSCLPCDITDLKVGDLVAIAPKAQRIVAKDGDLLSAGVVATVEAVPEGKGHVVVKLNDQTHVAWIHHKLLDQPLEVGDKVIYDDNHHFVLEKANIETKGNELLSDLATLQQVRRHQVGSPHPIADRIVNHFRDAIEHPEWLKALGSRDRKSYLFIGGTGGGKTYHIKLIATEVHDLIEEHCGVRHSRYVQCDASQFWDPYFGATEQKINAWAKKLEKLGSQKVKSKDGEELAMPILMVIEECEALFRSRGGGQHASGHLFDRVLSLLLQKLESAENAIGVPIVWVCSTNRPDLIDAAAMRRIGMRKAVFGNLNKEATKKVMLTKLIDLVTDVREDIDIANGVTGFLHDYEDGQKIADVKFQSGKSRTLSRRDLVTPAILEEAVSSAVDRCMDRSREAKKLQKVSAEDVVSFLDQHFKHLARTLTEHNLPEHCPEWFAEDASPVVGVKVCR